MEKKPLYHYKEGMSPSEKPAWAKEVSQQASTACTCAVLEKLAIMCFSSKTES